MGNSKSKSKEELKRNEHPKSEPAERELVDEGTDANFSLERQLTGKCVQECPETSEEHTSMQSLEIDDAITKCIHEAPLVKAVSIATQCAKFLVGNETTFEAMPL